MNHKDRALMRKIVTTLEEIHKVLSEMKAQEFLYWEAWRKAKTRKRRKT